MDLIKHLETRIPSWEMLGNVIANSMVDTSNSIITFPLWNLSGQMVGYQQYDYTKSNNYNGNSLGRNKYYTYCPKDKIGVFGLEYIEDMSQVDILYITEGVFDAISVMCCGSSAIAVLCNNPRKIRSWLRTLNSKTVAVCDGDKAGKSLAKLADEAIILPDGEDANSIDLETLKLILKR